MPRKVVKRKKKRKNKADKKPKLPKKKEKSDAELLFPAKILDDFSNDGATIT